MSQLYSCVVYVLPLFCLVRQTALLKLMRDSFIAYSTPIAVTLRLPGLQSAIWGKMKLEYKLVLYLLYAGKIIYVYA